MMSYNEVEQLAIRRDMFRWLDEKQLAGQYEFSRAELENEYRWMGQHIRLVSKMKGIWNPKEFDETLSILTGIKNPYNDDHSQDMVVRYAYQSQEGGDNIKLKLAHERGTPLIYFRAMRPGYYTAHYPVYVIKDDTDSRQFVVSLDEDLKLFANPLLELQTDERRWVERQIRARAHQPEFRWRVMKAYQETCAICHLKHVELLDAAHIVPDSHELGLPVISNGLSLCKIHHAAYDKDLIGITPDFEVRVNEELLLEIDGPMLKHGIQEMHGRSLYLPRAKAEHPDRENLDYRFQQFVAA